MKYRHRVLGMSSLLAVITCLDRVCTAVAGPRMPCFDAPFVPAPATTGV